MRRYHSLCVGFTLVELLVVIVVIAILTSILVPSLGYVMERAQRAKVKATITQLEQALFNYKTEYGNFPPDHELTNGGAYATTNPVPYAYRNDCLVKYLSGDTSFGVNRLPLFDFQEQYLRIGTTNRQTIYRDEFNEAYFYHNFHEDFITNPGGLGSKSRDATRPLHPWYNRINFQSVQIYSRANGGEYYGDNAYEGNATGTESQFMWITNYSK